MWWLWWLWRTTLIPNVRVQIKFLDIISCWKHKLHSHNSHAWLLTNTLSPEKEWWSQWTILKHSYNFTIYFALKWGWPPKEIMVIDIFYHVHQVIGNSRQTSACIRSRSRRPEQHQVHVPKIIHQTRVIVSLLVMAMDLWSWGCEFESLRNLYLKNKILVK